MTVSSLLSATNAYQRPLERVSASQQHQINTGTKHTVQDEIVLSDAAKSALSNPFEDHLIFQDETTGLALYDMGGPYGPMIQMGDENMLGIMSQQTGSQRAAQDAYMDIFGMPLLTKAKENGGDLVQAAQSLLGDKNNLADLLQERRQSLGYDAIITALEDVLL